MFDWLVRAINRHRYPVYHRVPHKKRKGMQPCTGVAFYRYEKGPIPLAEIPATCLTCGQTIKSFQLELAAVLEGYEPVKVAVKRRPRHIGQIVTEVSPHEN